MLNDKQERFCKEYVIDLNGTQAAIRAGYSDNTAKEQSSRLLTNANIQQRIQELQSEIGKRLELTVDMVVQELRALGFYNIQDLVDEEMGIIDIKQAERDILKPVVGLKITETWSEKGVRTVNTDIKLADKRAALVDIGKHLGIFEKDNKQKQIKIGLDVKETYE